MPYNTKLDFYPTNDMQALQSIQQVGQPSRITMQGLTPNTDYTCQAFLLEGIQQVSESLQATFRTIQAGTITLTHQSTTENGGVYTVVYSVASTYAISSAVMSINDTTVQGVVAGNTATFTVTGLVTPTTYPYTVTAYDLYDEQGTANGSITVSQGYVGQYFTIVNTFSGSNNITIYATSGGGNTTPIPNDFSYSLDEGNTWVDFRDSANGYRIALSQGDRLMLKHEGAMCVMDEYNIPYWHCINSSSHFSVEGNPMSLIYGDHFTDSGLTVPSYAFYCLFFKYSQSGITQLRDASNLYLGTPLESGSKLNMHGMFRQTALRTMPELPLTDLTEAAYNDMFYGCTSLATAGKLPARNIPKQAYSHMFRGCSVLTTAPDMTEAVSVGANSMRSMFCECTALKESPDIRNITSCDEYSFIGFCQRCRNLQIAYAPTIDFVSAPSYATYLWLRDVYSVGDLYADSSIASTIPLNSADGCPSGWTVRS